MPAFPIFQVDAFADRPFSGNPAAVVLLPAWLPDETLQAIAMENNLSETAFLVGADADYALRWFTPLVEVNLCGHATLASAHVVFTRLGCSGAVVRFQTRSGELTVRREGERLAMDFPARPGAPAPPMPDIAAALGARVVGVARGQHLLNVVETPAEVLALKPDFKALAAALEAEGFMSAVVTAPYDGPEAWDFVSRMFAPSKGIDEDPVTGAAHCALVPYWAQRLGRTELVARQVSRRGGTLWCTLAGDRVILRGQCRDYLAGEIVI